MQSALHARLGRTQNNELLLSNIGLYHAKIIVLYTGNELYYSEVLHSCFILTGIPGRIQLSKFTLIRSQLIIFSDNMHMQLVTYIWYVSISYH